MARAVGLSAAIGGRLLLEGALRRLGVLIPTLPEIYLPVLGELASYGLRFEEQGTVVAGGPA